MSIQPFLSSPIVNVLADETRFQIFAFLRTKSEPVSVGDISRGSGVHVSRPAVSQHLRALLKVDLVSVKSEGTRRMYTINRDTLAQFHSWVGTLVPSVKATAPAAEMESVR